MSSMPEAQKKVSIAERRDVTMIMGAILFAINFLSFYFIWLYVFPNMTGLIRLVACWIGAYALTWVMTLLAKGVYRIVLTIIMMGVQYLIFHYKP